MPGGSPGIEIPALLKNVPPMYNIIFLFFSPGKPIFSVDIHPDGSRFVTGGQGNFIFIKVWLIN